MMHSFDIEDAEKYGILSAVILQNIRFWTDKNKANRRHFYEGRYWVYNSVSAWSELFPYATKDQLRRALEKLREDGVLLVGNFNASPYDRTAWYCLSCQSDLANLPNENGENAEPIPDSKPVSNPVSKHKAQAPAPDGVSNETWAAYVDLRKKKRAPITGLVIDGIRREAENAGWPLENALRECCIRGWSGFKAEWVMRSGQGHQQQQPRPSLDDGQKRDYGKSGKL